MKAWICRDTSDGIVELHISEEPDRDDEGDFWGDYAIRLSTGEAESYFGFTPRKGSCKQYELTLKEIK